MSDANKKTMPANPWVTSAFICILLILLPNNYFFSYGICTVIFSETIQPISVTFLMLIDTYCDVTSADCLVFRGSRCPDNLSIAAGDRIM